jgi:hypothetical protein
MIPYRMQESWYEQEMYTKENNVDERSLCENTPASL